MERRQRLLGQVRARLERFGADHNPTTVLDPEGIAEVTALLELVQDPAADLAIAHAAGWLHWCRYLVLGTGEDQEDLADALALFAPVYRTRPDAVPDEVRTHFGRLAVSGDPQAAADRAVTLLEETLRTGDRAALDTAIDLLRHAVEASPADDPDRATYLSNLGGALQIRFEQTGDLADLDTAIDLLRRAWEASPADDPDRATYLSNLGCAVQGRFDRTGDLADLDIAIDLLRHAVAASPADHPDRAGRMSNLGGALLRRFERTGDRADLDVAITAGRQAVAESPADHPGRAMYLSILGAALEIRFVRTGDLADLDTAVDVLRDAVAASPAGHPGRSKYLSILGTALLRRFERIGNLADLDAVITASQQAVAESPADHPGRAMYFSILGTALQRRFERTGDLADLDTAIDLLRRAAAASPADHHGGSTYLSNLGIALQARFERTGDLADLDTAIDLLRRAVAASPADHPDRPMYLSNLGLAVQRRFERTGDLADLEAAITAGQQAVAESPADHPSRALRLSNLGSTLRIRFDRTGDRADLDTAIGLLRQAVAASPADHPGRAIYLSDLGGALQTRSERTGNLADLDAAITVGQQAVAASPADHPGRATYLSNLGGALQRRFDRTGDLADLDTAIDLRRQAVAASPADHPARAMYLSNLGSTLRIRFDRTGDLADLDTTIDLLRRAAAVEAASARVRAIAARGWGRTAADGLRWQEAVAGFAAAAELQGRAAPRSLTRADQEHLLEELGGLGADAAACCVHAGLPDRAVELFEQGRGVLLGQALDTRTDLTALTEQYPDLAARFTVMRDNLDRSDDPAGPPSGMPTGMDGAAIDHLAEAARRGIERRRATARAFDQVMTEIRDLPGFHGFLRPPQVTELLAAAAEGPVVVVTVSRFGSYALILTDSGVLDPVLLTGLTPKTLYDRVVTFIGALDDARSPAAGPGGRAAAEQRLGDTLGWLWEVLAAPVLDRLGITSAPRLGQPWPRLWWCLSGLLSFLPVHAAGYHRTRADAAPATVIDRVISSYTPTIRALTYARRPSPVTADDEGYRTGAGDQVVAVSMPHTPGAPDLPGAEAEASGLQQRFPGQVTVLTGTQATYDTVLGVLPTRRWAHFACHGTSDLNYPSASCLLLSDHQLRPLNVVDVARLRLDDAELAFLSACSTALPGGLADEAIHLASAFQLAGYRHVIATLWPIDDQHAVDIAARIYTTLTTGGNDVAGAVHAAIRLMRRRWGPDTPSAWASHIHAGA